MYSKVCDWLGFCQQTAINESFTFTHIRLRISHVIGCETTQKDQTVRSDQCFTDYSQITEDQFLKT